MKSAGMDVAREKVVARKEKIDSNENYTACLTRQDGEVLVTIILLQLTEYWRKPRDTHATPSGLV